MAKGGRRCACGRAREGASGVSWSLSCLSVSSAGREGKRGAQGCQRAVRGANIYNDVKLGAQSCRSKLAQTATSMSPGGHAGRGTTAVPAVWLLLFSHVISKTPCLLTSSGAWTPAAGEASKHAGDLRSERLKGRQVCFPITATEASPSRRLRTADSAFRCCCGGRTDAA